MSETNTPEADDAAQEATEATQRPQETQEAPEAASATVEAPADTQDDDGDQDHPAAEAKKYRLRLRETEAQRDTLAARLEAMQKAEVERLAGHLTQPAAIWAAGVKVADVLDDDGNVDPEKVTEATTAAAQALGLARRPAGPYVPSEGTNPHYRPRGDMANIIRG